MKRLYLLIIILSCGFCNTFAQRDVLFEPSDYKSDTIRMGDYAYICDTLLNHEISLYNLTNRSRMEPVRYKDGSPKPKGVDVVNFSTNTNRLLNSIIDEGFTLEQVEKIDGKRLIVFIDISSDDGSVTGVCFTFFKNTYYTQLPIDVFREMELRFKNEVRFELTEEGKKMTHYSTYWSQCPCGRDGGLTMPENGKLTLPDGKLGDAVGSLGGSVGLP